MFHSEAASSLGMIVFLGLMLGMALASSYIPGMMFRFIDRPEKRAARLAEQARIDAAPVNSPIAAR